MTGISTSDARAGDRRWEVNDPNYQTTVRRLFEAQRAMAHIGAKLELIEPGFVEIHVPFVEQLTQQHQVLHGGVVGMALDSACAFAAATLSPADGNGFTVEYKVNMLAPAVGEVLVARGWVERFGRRIVVSTGRAFAVSQGREKEVAVALETLMRTEPGTSG